MQNRPAPSVSGSPHASSGLPPGPAATAHIPTAHPSSEAPVAYHLHQFKLRHPTKRLDAISKESKSTNIPSTRIPPLSPVSPFLFSHRACTIYPVRTCHPSSPSSTST